MSQHHVQSQYNNRPVLVIAGWDRPLQTGFMTVSYVDRSEDEDDFVYNSMVDEKALADFQELLYFEDQLTQMGIATPLVLWQELYMESVLGGSSRVVMYDPDGTVISDTSHTNAGDA